MTSKADAIFTCKSFGSNLLPKEAPQAAAALTLKKKRGDALFTLQLSDATLRDVKSGVGAIASVEKPLGGGVKGTIAHNFGARDTIATVSLDKKMNGSDLTLKAQYHVKGDVLKLQETWKFDKNNKLVGNYDFSKEEAVFAYEHTRGTLKLGGSYSLKTEKPLLSIEKKQGKNTLTALYGPKDESATLTWQRKPFKVVLRGKAGKGGVTGVTAALTATKEFEL